MNRVGYGGFAVERLRGRSVLDEHVGGTWET